MVELRDAADWFPACAGVAVFAGNRNGAVGIVSGFFRPRLSMRRRQAGEQEYQRKPNEFCHAFARTMGPKSMRLRGLGYLAWGKRKTVLEDRLRARLSTVLDRLFGFGAGSNVSNHIESGG